MLFLWNYDKIGLICIGVVRMKLEDYKKLYQTMYDHQLGNVEVLASYLGISLESLNRLSEKFQSKNHFDFSSLDKSEKERYTKSRFCFYAYLGGFIQDDLMMPRVFNDQVIYDASAWYVGQYGSKEEQAAFYLTRMKRGKPGVKERKIREERTKSLMKIVDESGKEELSSKLASFFSMEEEQFLEKFHAITEADTLNYLNISGFLKDEEQLPLTRKELFYRMMIGPDLTKVVADLSCNRNSATKALRDYFQETTSFEKCLYLFCHQWKLEREKQSTEMKREAQDTILYRKMANLNFDSDRMRELAGELNITESILFSSLNSYRKRNHMKKAAKGFSRKRLERLNQFMEHAETFYENGITMSDGSKRPYDLVDFYLQFEPFTPVEIAPALSSCRQTKAFRHFQKSAFSLSNDACHLVPFDTMADPKKYTLQREITYPNGEKDIMTLFDNLELRENCIRFMKENNLKPAGRLFHVLLERSRYGDCVYEIPENMEFLHPEKRAKQKIK